MGESGPAVELVEGDLRLVRDRERRVVEVWVRWQGQRHLYGSGESDRHYLIERARGRLQFGDGVCGRIPPDGAAIVARLYRSGGGRRGNVAAGTITQAAASLGGVEELFNPVPAAGGAESETLLDVALRGARTLRHRSRAVSAADYETMALEASSTVAFARALPLRDPAGRRRTGWLTLQIIPESAGAATLADVPAPRAGTALRLRPRGAAGRHGSPPRDRADLPTRSTSEPAIVLRPAQDAGLVGGNDADRHRRLSRSSPRRTDGRGVEDRPRRLPVGPRRGRRRRVDGVDHVDELSMMSAELPQGERLRIPEGRVVAPGDVLVVVRG